MSGFEIRVTGLREAVGKLEPAAWEAGARRGLLKVGQAAADEVKRDIAPHHYTGRAEQQVHAEQEHIPGRISVHVGTSSALVPELRPLVYGWRSRGGKQPPTDAIATWLAHKPELAESPSVGRTAAGFLRFRRGATVASVAGESAVRARAFLIARAIGRRGYSFPPTDSFRKAWARVGPTATRVIAEEMRHHHG